MSLRVGIIGLPNVGKSTLFNALVKSSVAEAANYPFCTIEPNVGIVDIPDDKLPKLAEVVRKEMGATPLRSSSYEGLPAGPKIVPAIVEFVDIAGLVKGASQGEGLGNKFLSHIREVDAIILVLRAFGDSNVINVSQTPEDDRQTIEIELMLADLQTLTKRKETLAKEAKAGSEEAITLLAAIDKSINELENERPLRLFNFSDKERVALQQLSLLTLKPLMLVLNVSDPTSPAGLRGAREVNQLVEQIASKVANTPVIPVSAKIESEIAQLAPEEVAEFMESLGLKESGLDRISKTAYRLLGLQSYYTAGEKEARAWTIREGSTAPEAAGVIHTDFQKGFIAAEVISFTDFMALSGWSGGRTAGKVRTEGKTYVMQPDDVVLFRFNV